MVAVALAASTAQQVHAAVTGADVIAGCGGDPFHLLTVARRVAFGEAVRSALDAGTVYLGYSAGAMLAGPTLEPLSLTSPFTAPPGLELTGLGLVDVLVLPHDDHVGRHDRHLAAQAVFGARVRLVRLRDGDVLIHDDGDESVVDGEIALNERDRGAKVGDSIAVISSARRSVRMEYGRRRTTESGIGLWTGLRASLRR